MSNNAEVKINKRLSAGCSCVSVANEFLGFHVNYIINEKIILRRLFSEYNICMSEFYILIALYTLTRTNKLSRPASRVLVKRSQIQLFVEGFINRITLANGLKSLTCNGFIDVVRQGKSGFISQRVTCATLLSPTTKAEKVFKRYSELMRELYIESYYTRQAENKLQKAIETGEILPKLRKTPQQKTPEPVTSSDVNTLPVKITPITKR